MKREDMFGILSTDKFKIPIYWYVMFGYMLVTLLLSLLLARPYMLEFDMGTILMNRGVFMSLFFLIFYLKNKMNTQIFHISSLLIIYLFLGTVYKETAMLNTLLFDKQDDLVSHWDEFIFGMRPAVEFSKRMGNPIFSEMMFAGYFSYYLSPLFIIFSLYKTEKLNHFGFVLITSFVCYYIIFIIFPVMGPQFYYPSPENHIEGQGFFAEAVKFFQKIGEAPTAAFPSSHVGITTIMLLWLARYKKKLLYYIAPFSVLLFFATVYIKAHYAVDVLAGLFSGYVLYLVVDRVYLKIIYDK